MHHLKTTKKNLSDNISLMYVGTDKFKSSLLTLSLIMPYSPKSSAYQSVLSGVLGRGTTNYPDVQSINRRCDTLYSASVDIRTSRIGKNILINFVGEFLNNSLALDGTDILGGVLEIITELLYRPKLEDGLFPEAIVKQETGFFRDSIKAIINSPYHYSRNRCSELMHRDDPDFCTLEQVSALAESITRENVTSHYFQLLNCSELKFFYIGNEPIDTLSEKILSYFPSHSSDNSFPCEKTYPDKPCEFIRGSEKMPIMQGILQIGIRTGCGIAYGNHHAGILLNEILGASPASKLFLNIRERLGLCYTCSSSFDILSGNMMITTGLDVKNREIAEAEILKQFEDIRQGKITESELSTAKKALKNVYRQTYDTPLDVHNFYGSRDFFGSDEDIEECLNKIMALTVEDIAALAKQSVIDTIFFLDGALNFNDEEDDE